MENVDYEEKGKIKDDPLLWLSRLTSKPKHCASAENRVLFYLITVVMSVSESYECS